jgi:DHA2 family multidrug resistance protein
MASSRDIANRHAITAAMMLGSLLVAIDTTIANVALPHMQGSFSSSQDQTAWVLTSYIVASAVTTPLTSWLAARVGYKLVVLISIGGFTVASMLCGLSTNLAEIVVFRVLQGALGASLQPLSQAVMLDLYPASQLGQVMAISGSTVLIAPIAGPVVGGWITDNFSWRWVFFINLPIGALAFAGVWLFMSRGPASPKRPFDFLGFSALVVFIVALQLMLDRGSTLDWFSSTEIRIEALCAAIGLYVFLIQTLTGSHPFFDPALAKDRNFLTATFFIVAASGMLFSTIALQPPLMQGLLGYSVTGAGMLMAPRGMGSLAAMFLASRLIGRWDTRLILFCGLSLVAAGMLQMSHFELGMDTRPFITAGLLQGLGVGLVVVPVSALAFATIPPALRSDGAVVYAVLRNLGQSVGVSVSEAIFAGRLAVAHSDLAAIVQPADPVLRAGLPAVMNPHTSAGLALLNAEITRRASMIGYVDIFRLGMIGAFAVMPLIFILRPPKNGAMVAEVVAE